MALQAHAVHVVFRLDDPRPVYDSITMRVVQLFNAKQVPLTIAMVPCDSCESGTAYPNLYQKTIPFHNEMVSN